jgi:hypothetical protein
LSCAEQLKHGFILPDVSMAVHADNELFYGFGCVAGPARRWLGCLVR